MTSWLSWLAIGLVVLGVIYAIYSVYAKQARGLYVAAFLHIVLGILSLPSIGIYVLLLAVLEFIAGIIINENHTIKKSIHITNIIFLIGLVLFTFFAYFGMHFTAQNEPLTAEYIFMASLFLIWGIFYYLQMKLNSIRGFLIMVALEIFFFIAWGLSWGWFGHSLLEMLFE